MWYASKLFEPYLTCQPGTCSFLEHGCLLCNDAVPCKIQLNTRPAGLWPDWRHPMTGTRKLFPHGMFHLIIAYKEQIEQQEVASSQEEENFGNSLLGPSNRQMNDSVCLISMHPTMLMTDIRSKAHMTYGKHTELLPSCPSYLHDHRKSAHGKMLLLYGLKWVW